MAGLIKSIINSAKGAVNSTMQDQWKEAIRCPELGTSILAKKIRPASGVISNGSTIIVAQGQCAVIFDNGRIIDATADEGIYTFDTSSTPSFFQGQFGEVFKEMWQRFTYNGATAKEQFVLYFNIHEIPGAAFGTSSPIDFSDWSRPIPNQRIPGTMQPLLVSIKCHGTYTFTITNPALFMQKISGISDEFRVDELIGVNTKWGMQLRKEAEDVFTEIIQELGTQEAPVPVEKIGALRTEIKEIMVQRNFKQACEERGITITNFTIGGCVLTDESKADIKSYQLGSNVFDQQATLVTAYANAVQDAAKNEGGAMNGFMGIGMMNMQTGGTINGAVQSTWQNTQNSTMNANVNPNMNVNPNANVNSNVQTPKAQEQAPVAENADESWECPNCKKQVTGNFCSECGSKKQTEKYCTKCGAKIQKGAKFCSECGNKVE